MLTIYNNKIETIDETELTILLLAIHAENEDEAVSLCGSSNGWKF